MSKIQIRPPPPKPSISIENFDRSAENFTINESYTLEAMKRLGIRPFEIINKPIQAFAKSGCDESVTRYFYKKWEEQRNSLIQQVIEKRQEVLNEKGAVKPESPEVRREYILIDFDKKRLQQIDKQGEDILRHMFTRHIRDIQRQKMAEQAYDRSIQRANEIQRQQTERLQTARIAANNFVFKSREVKQEPPPYRPPSEDPAEIRRQQIRDELAKQRREQWAEKEKQIKSARVKAQEILDQKINMAKQTILRDDQRFSAWKVKAQTARLNRTVPHIRTYEEVSQVLKQREEERRKNLLTQIADKETRFDGNRARLSEEQKQKYRNISQQEQEKMERVAQARKEMEIEAQKKRDQFSKEAAEMQQNADKARSRDMLKVAERICERDEKLAQAQRRKLALEYEAIRARQLTEYDKVRALQVQQEKQKVSTMKTGAQIRLQQRRERLANELSMLHSLEDTRRLESIRGILELSEDEMQNMISSSLNSMSKTT